VSARRFALKPERKDSAFHCHCTCGPFLYHILVSNDRDVFHGFASRSANDTGLDAMTFFTGSSIRSDSGLPVSFFQVQEIEMFEISA
jgi:hypothetical protein